MRTLDSFDDDFLHNGFIINTIYSKSVKTFDDRLVYPVALQKVFS